MLRSRVARLAAVFAVVGFLPLALLTYFSLSFASDAVRAEVERRVASNAAMTAKILQEEMTSLAAYVESYSRRPSLIETLGEPPGAPGRNRMIARHLRDLKDAHEGVYTAFLASADGTLVEIVPATPAILGKNYAFRDWYGGVTRTGRPYVSQAYRTQAAGTPLVVAAAAPVRANGRVVAIIVAAYSLEHIQDEADAVAEEHSLLKVTDQRGTLLARTGRPVTRLVSRTSDQRVRAALQGRSGVLELDTPDGRRVSAYAPVRELGWTVTASVPANTAFAAIADLRSAVLSIAAVLAVVLLGALALLIRSLRSRQQAEREAERLATINRAVLDATPDGILLVDPDGNRLLDNAALRELATETPRGAIENIYAEVDDSADRLADPSGFRRVMSEVAGDPDRQAAIELDADDGRAFRLYTAPVRAAESGVLGRIFVVRDRTAEREAERLKSELVATVSHELRTPLASILGFAELLAARGADGPARDAYVSTIYNEAKRLTNLINDFLDLQRIEAGDFTVALEPFDLRNLLPEQIEVFSRQSQKHTLKLDLADDDLNVLGERDRIAQVVANLVSNAIKYSPGGGTVRVSAEAAEGGVRVAVRDEGVGVPEDQQRKLFTKFFRVDSSDTREIGGTGLGLALCREIMEAHGGRIGFESAEGVGSTFWFWLPAGASGNGSRRRGRVLVVEDDRAAAELLASYLEVDGHDVEVVATAEEALGRAVADPPLLICLDVALGGEVDGWQALARLKASPATAEVPVIICTGKNGRSHAAALGAADFVTKPFSQERLRSAISRVLPERRGSILVVDDEENVRRLVAETLRPDGHELREAADGEEALREIAAERPDALILDLMMPKLDGFAVLERLHADPETRRLPVVVLTARNLSEDERRFLCDRTTSLLEKSAYSRAELRRLVASALAQ